MASLEDDSYPLLYRLHFKGDEIINVPFSIVQRADYFKCFHSFETLSKQEEMPMSIRSIDLKAWDLRVFQPIFLYMQSKQYIHLETLSRTQLAEIERLADFIQFEPLRIAHVMIRMEWIDLLGEWQIRMCSHLPYIQKVFNINDSKYKVNSDNPNIRDLDRIFLNDVYAHSLRMARDLVSQTGLSVSRLRLVGQKTNDWRLDINLVSDGKMSAPCHPFTSLIASYNGHGHQNLCLRLLSPIVECIDSRLFRGTNTIYRRSVSCSLDRHFYPDREYN